MSPVHVAVLGAGPIGLEAALAAAQRGHTVDVYEAAPTVGGNVADWGHVRTFTPWSMNVSPGMRAALGGRAPDGDHLPTGGELVADLLEPVAALPALAGRVHVGVRVRAVAREGLLKHEAIGTPERAALNAGARELADGASDAVRAHVGVVTEALRAQDGRIAVTLRNGTARDVVVDHVLALNGGHPDASIYRQLQVQECYATLGPIRLAAVLLGETGGDCLAESTAGPETLVNPEPGFFILGAKSYGRNSQFLLRVGWQQVDDVFGSLIPA